MKYLTKKVQSSISVITVQLNSLLRSTTCGGILSDYFMQMLQHHQRNSHDGDSDRDKRTSCSEKSCVMKKVNHTTTVAKLLKSETDHYLQMPMFDEK